MLCATCGACTRRGTCSELAKSSPIAGLSTSQKISGAALTLLALIFALAFAFRGGDAPPESKPFNPSSYSSPSASGSTSSSGTSAKLGTVQFGALPKQAKQTIALIDAGGPYPYVQDDAVFGNYEHQLPAKPRGWYHEYTVKTPGESDRGARRIVTGKDGTMYYTDDHYATFERVQR